MNDYGDYGSEEDQEDEDEKEEEEEKNGVDAVLDDIAGLIGDRKEGSEAAQSDQDEE